MGCSCCRQQQPVRGPAAQAYVPQLQADMDVQLLGNALGGLEDSVAGSIYVLGKPDSGKTCLFLRLTFPRISESDAVAVTSETETFHCEPLDTSSSALDLGDVVLWDIGGREFNLRANIDSIKDTGAKGIMWVASMLDTSDESIGESILWIKELLNMPALQKTFFLLIFNTVDLFENEPFKLTDRGTEELNVLLRKYDVLKLYQNHSFKFNWTVSNVKAGWNDPRLSQVLPWIKSFL